MALDPTTFHPLGDILLAISFWRDGWPQAGALAHFWAECQILVFALVVCCSFVAPSWFSVTLPTQIILDIIERPLKTHAWSNRSIENAFDRSWWAFAEAYMDRS